MSQGLSPGGRVIQDIYFPFHIFMDLPKILQ